MGIYSQLQLNMDKSLQGYLIEELRTHWYRKWTTLTALEAEKGAAKPARVVCLP